MSFLLQQGNIFIREYKRSDLLSVHEMLSDPIVYRTTCAIPLNCSLTFASRWLECVRKSLKKEADLEYGIFSAHNGEYIGNVGLIGIDYINRSANITYIITPKFHHMGYGCAAAKMMVQYGFETLGLTRIHGKCMDFNTASKMVMLKCGFLYEGTGRGEMIKEKKLVNIEHYGILKNDYLKLKGKIYL